MRDEILIEVARLQREAEQRVANRGKPATQYANAVVQVLAAAGHGLLAQSLCRADLSMIDASEKDGQSPAQCAARIIETEALSIAPSARDVFGLRNRKAA